MSSSRLDRLFILLENGGSSITRGAAAQQLGDVIRTASVEPKPLLERVLTLLSSKCWDSRVAAAAALGAVLGNVPHNFKPVQVASDTLHEDEKVSLLPPPLNTASTLEHIRALLNEGLLLGAASELPNPDSGGGGCDTERQRELLNQKLGLDIANTLGIDTSHIITANDLIQHCPESSSSTSAVSEAVTGRPADAAAASVTSKDVKTSGDDEGGGAWAFAWLCDRLKELLSHSSWENRHGAAMGLREMLKTHGESGGVSANVSEEERVAQHQEWLWSLVEALVSILARDTFGDYVADQVVAPVRETAAQALGIACVHLHVSFVPSVLELLKELMVWEEPWTVRHGGVLGLKYVLATRSDIRSTLLQESYDTLLYNGLRDQQDDVVGIAADCLSICCAAFTSQSVMADPGTAATTQEEALSCSKDSLSGDDSLLVIDLDTSRGKMEEAQEECCNLVEWLGGERLQQLLSTVWKCLVQVDDLSASTPSLLMLLANLIKQGNSNRANGGELVNLVPRLFPFLYHNCSSVRRSALASLAALTSVIETKESSVQSSAANGVGNHNHSPSSPVNVSVQKSAAGSIVQHSTVKQESDCSGAYSNVICDNNSLKVSNLSAADPSSSSYTLIKSKLGDFRLWCHSVLSTLLRHLFQRCLIESDKDNLELIGQVWCQVLQFCELQAILMVTCPLVSQWMCLIAASSNAPLDTTLLLPLPADNSHKTSSTTVNTSDATSLQRQTSSASFGLYLGGSFPCDKSGAYNCRSHAAALVGQLSLYITQPMPGVCYQNPLDPLNCYVRLILAQLRTQSAQQRLAAALVLREWAIRFTNLRRKEGKAGDSLYLGLTLEKRGVSIMSELDKSLDECLTNPVCYDEIAVSFTRLQQDTKDFLSTLKHYGINVESNYLLAPVLTLDQISQITGGEWMLSELNSSKVRTKVRDTLETRRKNIMSSHHTTTTYQETLNINTRAVLAGAVIRLGKLPQKMNPIIKPLVDAIKTQELHAIQVDASNDLALLLDLCGGRAKSPNAKVLKNLCSYYCADSRCTPQIVSHPQADHSSGIYLLKTVDESQQLTVSTPSNGTKNEQSRNPIRRKRGRPSKNAEPTPVEPTVCSNSNMRSSEMILKELEIQRRGCHTALQTIVKHFKDRLPSALPSFWEMIMNRLLSEKQREDSLDCCKGGTAESQSGDNGVEVTDAMRLTGRESVPVIVAPPNLLLVHPSSQQQQQESISQSIVERDKKAQAVINFLQLLEVVIPVLHDTFIQSICLHLVSLEQYVYHGYSSVRHMAARVFAALIARSTSEVMLFALEHFLPALKDVHSVTKRQGAMECLFMIIDKLGLQVLPYVVLLIVPLLRSSSDSDYCVRTVGSQAFAALIKLLPLDGFMPDPPSLPAHVCEQRDQHRKFLLQLMDGKKAHQYKMPIKINASLRDYQQTGLNWLAFLRDYGVHGILCDDMGLGKTLQTICILASTHHEYYAAETKERDTPEVQSLVVCPPTLTGHWMHEIEVFTPEGLLHPLHYTGPTAERLKLRKRFSDHNVIIASYDIVRNEIDYFSKVNWLYIILDEGHLIKNTKTKSYQAIKSLGGRHRLILSGTPIQNTVLELWALFDFLMPGYLGTEKHFIAKYSRPIQQSRDSKASKADQEGGVVAMEALHRQTLPFMMRRVKEDVLKELPPKITQDYYCELSAVQKILYQDFLANQGQDLEDEDAPKTHVFQALQYLRLVCNHPALVMRPQHPRYKELLAKTAMNDFELRALSVSAKLPALRDLLMECGIGTTNTPLLDSEGGGGTCVVAPHRVLIFCQLRAMLDIIERDLFKRCMPSVSYSRLDGSVPAGQRYGLVQKFNQDPSIDVMLLTTQVGGLGLNLTAADTVIFVEHDWNPMKDLQAMDRVHRIGQTRVVNVYRLITRNTLEEKIMGLQKFKLFTANTVISQENASINTMGTGQVLDLVSMEGSSSFKTSKADGGREGAVLAPGRSSVLESLPELWDDAQYHDEYDIDKFLANITKK